MFMVYLGAMMKSLPKHIIVSAALVVGLALIIGFSGTSSPVLWVPYAASCVYLVGCWIVAAVYGVYRLGKFLLARHRHAMRVVRNGG